MPVTAVRTALSPGHARPSRPKVRVQSAHWYAFLVAVLTTAGKPAGNLCLGVRPSVVSWRSTTRSSPVCDSLTSIIQVEPNPKHARAGVRLRKMLLWRLVVHKLAMAAQHARVLE